MYSIHYFHDCRQSSHILYAWNVTLSPKKDDRFTSMNSLDIGASEGHDFRLIHLQDITFIAFCPEHVKLSIIATSHHFSNAVIYSFFLERYLYKYGNMLLEA